MLASGDLFGKFSSDLWYNSMYFLMCLIHFLITKGKIKNYPSWKSSFQQLYQSSEQSASGSQMLSRVLFFTIPWTVACQAPLSLGVLQARILQWVAISFSRGSCPPRNRTWVSCIGRQVFTTSTRVLTLTVECPLL